MNGVIIRCPNCGTTQFTLGECEACREADTRYFCTNHDSGRWLDEPQCAACGARYGVGSPTSRPVTRASPEPSAWPPSAPTIDEREPALVDVWSSPGRTPERGEVVEIEDPGLTLAATAGGCVRRAVVLALILLVLAALAIFALLGGGLRLL